MKHLIFSVLLLASAALSAQTPIEIGITVQHETIRRGPYARYAQPLLGAVAPLSDKENFSILSAAVSVADESATAVENTPYNAPTLDFDGLQIDRMSTAGLSLEQAATEAARALFTLRQRRFDLVTGEAGENVYGAGMAAALEEMARLEAEYTALFLGRRTVQTETKTIRVIPEIERNTLIVSRFTDSAGLLPQDDLSGRPIVLELTRENPPQPVAPPVPARSGREARETVIPAPVAEPVRYRLIDEGRVLASGQLIIVYN